jgi:hypothetical protein
MEPNVKCLSIADLTAASSAAQEDHVITPSSHEDFQEVFLNFHFTGSELMRRRPAVNTIHFKSSPMPLQVYVANIFAYSSHCLFVVCVTLTEMVKCCNI